MRYVGVLAGLLWVTSGGAAWAGPVVREASGLTPASIQAVVDQFRADLGPNNGLATGSQAGGRREINWDGGGPTAPPTLDPSPMTRFAGRGATFLTSGTGFEISAASGPSAEFADINPSYPALFAPFSTPRLFIALNTNEMDVVFNVPGNAAVPAGVTGFGAVFTDVDSATSTRLQFFAPDGALLFERAVPAASGSETQSFLGVSFDNGEIVGRVRIVSGNTAFGPDETGALDLVAMDDFIYGEPVSTEGLVISPASGTVFQIGSFDLTIGVESAATPPIDARLRFDGADAPEGLVACFTPAALNRGRTTFSCQVPRNLLTEGEHVVQVVVTFADQTSRRNAVRWSVIGVSEQ
jgi:hypothetical protein